MGRPPPDRRMTALFGSNRRISSLAMTDVGHEERFPPTSLSAGSGFRKETIAGTRSNGRDTPLAVTDAIAVHAVLIPLIRG